MRNWNQAEALSGRHLLTELVRPRCPTIWNIYDLPPISSTSSTPSSTERIVTIEEGEALQGTGKDDDEMSHDHLLRSIFMVTISAHPWITMARGRRRGQVWRWTVCMKGEMGYPCGCLHSKTMKSKTKSASKPVLSSTAGRSKQGYSRIRP